VGAHLGGGAFLITGELHAKHRTSDAEVVTPYQQRLEVRDGLFVKGRMNMGALHV
jgi:hypothetical protein